MAKVKCYLSLQFLCPTGISAAAVSAALESDQPGARPQVSSADSTFFAQTYRQHCSHLLHFLYHLWYSRSAGKVVVIISFDKQGNLN